MTVPVFIKALTNIDHLLTQSEKFAAEKGISESEFLSSRLAPDMFPLLKQVQVVTDNAKGAAARLAGVEIPTMTDEEVSFADLHARIVATIAFLKTLKSEQFEDAATRKIHIKYFPGKHFLGHGYLAEYALPNFYFHFVTIYAILRMKGLTIGKADYMGGLPLQEGSL